MPETERSGFFNAQLLDGAYDRQYEAEDFSKYFELFFGDGVFVNPADQLMVSASSGLNISIKAGNAFIKGHYYELLEDTTMTIPASSSPRRVDVCLVLNMTDRTITRKLLVSQGSGNSIPALSAPTNTENVRELKLATIPIPAGTSTITNSMITDLRPNEVYCGYVKGAIESIETGDLFQQFTDAFTTWFDDIKGQLTEDAAGNLQTQINDLPKIYAGTSDPSDSIGKAGDIYIKVIEGGAVG